MSALIVVGIVLYGIASFLIGVTASSRHYQEAIDNGVRHPSMGDSIAEGVIWAVIWPLELVKRVWKRWRMER
jgi:hypothetical protein